MPRWLSRLLIVFVIIAAGVALRFTIFRPEPIPVTLYRVDRGAVEETVANSKAGTVKARRRARMSPEIGGRVAMIGARPGDEVREGEVLLRINDADLRASLALTKQDVVTAEAGAREACLSAGQADRELKRNIDLSDQNIVSEEVLDRLRSDRDVTAARCEAARAAVSRARAAVALAEANLGKALLRAPFDGIVADLDAELGEWVSPSPPAVPIPPVYDIIDRSSIYISAPMDEVDAARIEAGQQTRITLDPYPDQSFDGTVTRVAPYVLDIQEQNRTIEVEVDFEDAEFSRTLLPGASADVEIILRRVENVRRIPSYALMEGDRVLVLEGDVLAGRAVQIGLRNWEYAEVVDGLEEGEAIVISLDRAEVKEGAYAVESDSAGR